MNIPLFPKPLLLLAGAVGFTALGFFIGQSQIAGARLKTPVSAPTSETLSSSSPTLETRTNSQQPSELIKTWSNFQNQPMTPDSEERMRECLKALAVGDHEAALRLAQSASTPRQREIFRAAALNGWASVDPLAAATWTLSNVRSEERRSAVEAITSGAVVHPDAAIHAVEYLLLTDPLQASDHGNALVAAFVRAGLFDQASKFAATGPTEYRAAWLSTAFTDWAVHQPQAALDAMNQIKDPITRRDAMQGVIVGWSSSDPASLVAYAEKLPVGEVRFNALHDGLQQWVYRDPARASEWMDAHDPNPDLDAGAAAVALLPALLEKKPEVATSWAESITDPELRINTLIDLIRIWGTRDPEKARSYAATTPALPDDRRELAFTTLQPSP